MVSATPTSLLQPDQAAELVLSFVNTRHNKIQTEQFPDTATLKVWMLNHDLIGLGDEVTETDLQDAKQLRTALVTLMLSHLHEPETEETDVQKTTEDLHQIAKKHPLVSLVSLDGVELVPVHTGGSGALGKILAALTELVLTGRWNRMKACRNDTCQTAFYDRTRNGAGTFCSQNPCGAMMAMRAYRKRKQESTQESS